MKNLIKLLPFLIIGIFLIFGFNKASVVISTIFSIVYLTIIAGVKDGIDKSKATAYLAKKYDDSIK